MPKIAQAQSGQVSSQVVSQPRASGKVDPAAFGAPVSQGLEKVAGSVVGMMDRISTTEAEEALTQFERDKNDVFFNPKTGYFNTNGRNAYDSAGVAGVAIEDLKKQHGDGLSEQARLKFDKVAVKHVTRSQLDISRHASKGLQVWEVATIEAQVENTLENGALYWSDPQAMREQRVLGEMSIRESAGITGIGPEATAEKLQNFRSQFASNAVSAATVSSAAEGKAQFDSMESDLEGPDRVKLQKSINAKVKSEKVKSDATLSVLTAARLVGQYEDRGDIIAEVDKINDVELRKKTMTESMGQFRRNQIAEKEKAADSYYEVIGEVNTGLTPLEIQSKNPEAWLGMTDFQRNNILSGKHMLTDQKKFNQVLTLPTKELAEVDPVDFTHLFRPTDMTKLRAAVKSAKKGKPGSRVKSLSAKTMMAAESAFGKKSRWITTTGKANSRGLKANQFITDMQDAIDDFEDTHDRKIEPSEENKLISEFTRQIVAERSLLGLDILATDVELGLSNTPPTHMRVLNRVIDNTPNIDVPDLVSAYQYLISNEQEVTLSTLSNVYKQGRE